MIVIIVINWFVIVAIIVAFGKVSFFYVVGLRHIGRLANEVIIISFKQVSSRAVAEQKVVQRDKI